MSWENPQRITGHLQRPKIEEQFKDRVNRLPELIEAIYEDLNRHIDRTIYDVDDAVTLPDTSGSWAVINLRSDDGTSDVDCGWTVPATAFGVGCDVEIASGVIQFTPKLRVGYDGTTETATSGYISQLTGPSERLIELPITDREARTIRYNSTGDATLKLRFWRIRPLYGD